MAYILSIGTSIPPYPVNQETTAHFAKDMLKDSFKDIDRLLKTFKNGEIIDVKAEKGEEVLKDLISTDEGSKRLGEVALVPDDSPISNRNTIFYNTLFDENASCHLAIGSAYGFNIKGGTEMSTEEKIASGLNDSNVHVDFMIGSSDLTIYGILQDGSKELVFENGNWAQ